MIAKTAPAVRWLQKCLSSYWILKLKPLQCREASKFCVVTRPSLCGLLEPEVLRKGSTGVGSTCVHLAICTQMCWSVSSEPYPAQPGSVQLAQHTLTAQENLPGFRPAVGAPLLPTWPALTFTMCSMGQKARPKHILGFCSCQTWLGIPGTETLTDRHMMGSFSHVVHHVCCCRLLLILTLQPLHWIFSLNPCLDWCRFF